MFKDDTCVYTHTYMYAWRCGQVYVCIYVHVRVCVTPPHPPVTMARPTSSYPAPSWVPSHHHRSHPRRVRLLTADITPPLPFLNSSQAVCFLPYGRKKLASLVSKFRQASKGGVVVSKRWNLKTIQRKYTALRGYDGRGSGGARSGPRRVEGSFSGPRDGDLLLLGNLGSAFMVSPSQQPLPLKAEGAAAAAATAHGPVSRLPPEEGGKAREERRECAREPQPRPSSRATSPLPPLRLPSPL